MVENLEELIMRRTQVPERPEVRRLWELMEANRLQDRALGEERGKAAALMIVLKARDVALSDAQRARIEGCRDSKTLQLWLERAASAMSADELFG
jgi:hypothetical protein